MKTYPDNISSQVDNSSSERGDRWLIFSVVAIAIALAAAVALESKAQLPGGTEVVFNYEGENPLATDTVEHQYTSPEIGNRKSVGLVLSGGGAKGIAHVGVIKALEDNQIPIDYVAGTSMGSIVGSLYACGYSPEDMMKLFLSDGFRSWSSGRINRDLTFYASEPPASASWVNLYINPKDSSIFTSDIIPSSLINPIPMNLEFLRLYAPYTEQCRADFDKLMVPFRCVASDIYHKHKVVFSKGSLGESVRASMSFPLVFKPIEIDGVLMYDGGIYDNFPVNVMNEDFDPDLIIGVSVSGADTKPIANDIYSQLEDMIIQNNDYSVPKKEGIKIQVPVTDFGVLDWGQAQTIYNIGYQTGLSMVDSIKKRTPARIPPEAVAARRERFKNATPKLMFDSISIQGCTKGQADYLRYLMQGRRDTARLDIEQVSEGYYRAISTGKFADLLPLAQPASLPRILDLKANVRNRWNVGFGGWITSSTNSMLYLSTGYHTLSANSLDLDLGFWVGQSYYAAEGRARFGLRTPIMSWLEVTGVVSKTKFFDSELLFYEDKSPTFINDFENYIKVNYGWAIGRKAKGYLSLGYGHLKDTYYPAGTTDFTTTKRDKSRFNIGQLRIGYEKNTLNDFMYPSAGMEFKAYAQGLYLMSDFLPGGDRARREVFGGHVRGMAEIVWRHYFPLHKKFTLGALANGVATIGSNRQNYTVAMIQSPSFAPTPSMKNVFNIGFRADNYLAGGIIPIFKPFHNAQLRGDFFIFAPVREMKNVNNMAVQGAWFRRCEFMGELAAVYNLSFASISLYGNYMTYPKRNWNFGISLGMLIQAPRFLR